MGVESTVGLNQTDPPACVSHRVGCALGLAIRGVILPVTTTTISICKDRHYLIRADEKATAGDERVFRSVDTKVLEQILLA